MRKRQSGLGYWLDGEWVSFELVGHEWHFSTGERLLARGGRSSHRFRDPQLAGWADVAAGLGARMGPMGSQYSVVTGKVTTGALGAAAAKTMILLNPATDGFMLTELWISYGAIVSQTDIAVELYRTNTLGSPAGTSATVNKDNPNEAAATTTGLTALSAEPTSVITLRELYLPVNQGFVVVPWPLGREPYAAPAGARLGHRVVNDEAGTMTAVNTRNTMIWVEE